MPEVLKFLMVPGSWPLFVAVAAPSFVLVWQGGLRRWYGVAAIAVLGGSYVLLSLPRAAERLARPLIQYGPLRDAGQAADAEAIVVLSGDSRHARIVETLRLYQWLNLRWVVVSGSTDLRDELLVGGVAADRVLLEPSSRTTREQAVSLRRLLKSSGIRRFVVVASAIHMPRALRTMRALGLDAIPSASATRTLPVPAGFSPSLRALRFSRESTYEHLALAVYRLRGWI